MKCILYGGAYLFGLGMIAGALFVWSYDTDAPYVRNSGRIVAEDPVKCGLPENTPNRGKIVPGGCVAIEWIIDILRTDCYPVSDQHVSRWIKDANGEVHILPKVERVFGPGREPMRSPLRRAFIHPKDIDTPGPAQYHSESCYTCNPYHWVFRDPRCVTTPDAFYTIEASDATTPSVPTIHDSESIPAAQKL